MTREKQSRPTTLADALEVFKKVRDNFNSTVDTALEALPSDPAKAEREIKEGHAKMLALKDSYNHLYGHIQTAARKPKKEKSDKAEVKPATGDDDSV